MAMIIRQVSSYDADEFLLQYEDLVNNSNVKYNLAVCFVSDSHLTAEFCERLGEFHIPVFGTSSREEICGSEVNSNSLSATLFSMPHDSVSLQRFIDDDSFSLGVKIATWSTGIFKNPALLMIVGGGGFTVQSEQLLSGIFQVQKDLPVYGGLASMQNSLETSYAFDGEGMFDDGVLALAVDRDQIELEGLAISGWSEIGTPKVITRSEGNTVYEIEGVPATDFYEKYFKVTSAEDADVIAVMEYPLLVQYEDGRKAMRTPIQLDLKNKAVVYAAGIPQNARVRFCSPNIVDTIQTTIQEIQKFRDERQNTSPDAVLLFDCAIRSQSFGAYMQKEIQFIARLWQAPVAGFSSWGEIGNRRGEVCGLHNTTISIVTLKAKGFTESKQVPVLTKKEIAESLSSFEENADPEQLKRHLIELRKQKTMLSHFLHLNSDDLDTANASLAIERQKSEKLLLNILPESIADRLKNGEKKIADSYENVSVLFADLVGFTVLSGNSSAPEIVRMLNLLFRNFDNLCEEYGIEKIKTIGDAYMAAAGLPKTDKDHALRMVRLAQGMLKCMKQFNEKEGSTLQLRIGIHSGPVVAGVIGKNKFTYDLWGDTVNVASRMESHGLPGRVHMSEATAALLPSGISMEKRGEVEIKGKGKMQTFFLAESGI